MGAQDRQAIGPCGLSLVDSGRPSSEPSEAAIAQVKARGAAGASSTFRFKGAGVTEAERRPLSAAAARLATPAVCTKYARPNDLVRPGDNLPVVDKLLGIIGARRAQFTPAQVLQSERGSAKPLVSTAQRAQQVAPPPPRGVASAAPPGPPSSRSKLVEQSWGLLQDCDREGGDRSFADKRKLCNRRGNKTKEEPRTVASLNLAGECSPLADRWKYLLWDKRRRSFAGYLHKAVPKSMASKLLASALEGEWLQPKGRWGQIFRKKNSMDGATAMPVSIWVWGGVNQTIAVCPLGWRGVKVVHASVWSG